MVLPYKPQMTIIRRMRSACRITGHTHTHTHTECAILNGFSTATMVTVHCPSYAGIRRCANGRSDPDNSRQIFKSKCPRQCFVGTADPEDERDTRPSLIKWIDMPIDKRFNTSGLFRQGTGYSNLINRKLDDVQLVRFLCLLNSAFRPALGRSQLPIH